MESTRTTRGTGQRETGQSSRHFQYSSNGPNGRLAGSASQEKFPTRRHFWLPWVIHIGIINLLFYAPCIFRSFRRQQSTITLSSSNFLQQVEWLLAQARQLTQNVLTEHGDALDRLAQAQFQEEILARNPILAMVNGSQNIPGGAR